MTTPNPTPPNPPHKSIYEAVKHLRSSTPPARQELAEEIDLTPEDEAILDAIEDRLAHDPTYPPPSTWDDDENDDEE